MMENWFYIVFDYLLGVIFVLIYEILCLKFFLSLRPFVTFLYPLSCSAYPMPYESCLGVSMVSGLVYHQCQWVFGINILICLQIAGWEKTSLSMTSMVGQVGCKRLLKAGSHLQWKVLVTDVRASVICSVENAT